VRGGGEMASAAARLLFLAGFPVVVLELARPLAVRRLVSYAEAVHCGEMTVEGLSARRVADAAAAAEAARSRAFLPVLVDPAADSLPELPAGVLVDARMLKHEGGPGLGQAALVVGVGPGFVAGSNVHAVVETQRGPGLGRVLWEGAAAADTALPAAVEGITEARMLRAPRAGCFRAAAQIGDMVEVGTIVGNVSGTPVVARAAGLLRGLLRDGVEVEAGIKLGDVDPRGRAIDPAAISDKARAVAAGVLEAVLVGLARRR